MRRALLPPRSNDDRVFGGVCGGLGAAAGLDPVIVRIATVVVAIAGPGLLIYGLAWIVMPRAREDLDGAEPGGHLEMRRTLGLALTVLGAVLVARAIGASPPDQVIWPVVVLGGGAAVLFWQVSPGGGFDRFATARVMAGLVVMAAGLAALVAANVGVAVLRDGLFASALIVGGLALVVAPWITVLVKDRAEQRRLRIRADERSEVAAHLHDSVLQTFAMIQRTDDPRRVASLARRQERELRRWLYGAGATDDDGNQQTLRAALERVVADVEDLHGVTIELVVVGEAAVDPTVEGLLAATGEAMANAAKWSGQDRLSVFVESSDTAIEAFVRDTGVGFDLDAVGDDRLGLRESIRGRMQRLGGECEIVTGPGEGTEVRLRIERNTD